MKNLIKNLKGKSKTMKTILIITLISNIALIVMFTLSLLKLTGIETGIRTLVIILTILYAIIYLIFGTKETIHNKKITFTLLTIITILLNVIYGIGSYYINNIMTTVGNVTIQNTSKYTTVLLTKTTHEFNSSSKIGIVTDEEDKTSNILALEYINKNNVSNKLKYYTNVKELMEGFKNNEVDAIFITDDYKIIYGNDESYEELLQNVKVVAEYSKEFKNEESTLINKTKSLTEPFTVLVLGVDSESQGGLDANAAFNGDTLMLITFNPKTLTATMFSFPRDMYVPILSSSGRTLWYGKINSSSAYGTMSTIKTLESLTDVTIDYFIKVNFQGAIDIVNAIGGIDVDVEQPDYNYYVSYYGEGKLCESNAARSTLAADLVCMNTGMQHLTGEQALAYARNRHGFLESDLARNRHQQQIIEALSKKIVKTSSLSDFQSLLKALSNNIATNMTTDQILSFYSSIKGMLSNALNGEDFITMQKMQLTYYNLDLQTTSALGYYLGSMNAITKGMKQNLGILETSDTKTFTYDYSEDYEKSSEIIGKGIYSGGKSYDIISSNNKKEEKEEEKKEESKEDKKENDEPMEDLTGKTVSYAKEIAKKYDLSFVVTDEDGNTITNPILTSIITDQSIRAGNKVDGYVTLKVYIKNTTKEENTSTEDDDNSSSTTPTTPDTNNTDTNTNPDTNNNDTSNEEPDNNSSDLE